VPLIQVIVAAHAGAASRTSRCVVGGSTRPPEGFDLEILDLRDHPLPLYDRAVPPARSLRDYPDEDVGRLGRTIERADGFIIVTSEYNHGYHGIAQERDGATCSPELQIGEPVGVRARYGNVGGARAIEQLRLVAVEFEMAPLRHAIHILPELMIAAMRARSVLFRGVQLVGPSVLDDGRGPPVVDRGARRRTCS